MENNMNGDGSGDVHPDSILIDFMMKMKKTFPKLKFTKENLSSVVTTMLNNNPDMAAKFIKHLDDAPDYIAGDYDDKTNQDGDIIYSDDEENDDLTHTHAHAHAHSPPHTHAQEHFPVQSNPSILTHIMNNSHNHNHNHNHDQDQDIDSLIEDDMEVTGPPITKGFSGQKMITSPWLTSDVPPDHPSHPNWANSNPHDIFSPYPSYSNKWKTHLIVTNTIARDRGIYLQNLAQCKTRAHLLDILERMHGLVMGQLYNRTRMRAMNFFVTDPILENFTKVTKTTYEIMTAPTENVNNILFQCSPDLVTRVKSIQIYDNSKNNNKLFVDIDRYLLQNMLLVQRDRGTGAESPNFVTIPILTCVHNDFSDGLFQFTPSSLKIVVNFDPIVLVDSGMQKIFRLSFVNVHCRIQDKLFAITLPRAVDLTRTNETVYRVKLQNNMLFNNFIVFCIRDGKFCNLFKHLKIYINDILITQISEQHKTNLYGLFSQEKFCIIPSNNVEIVIETLAECEIKLFVNFVHTLVPELRLLS